MSEHGCLWKPRAAYPLGARLTGSRELHSCGRFRLSPSSSLISWLLRKEWIVQPSLLSLHVGRWPPRLNAHGHLWSVRGGLRVRYYLMIRLIDETAGSRIYSDRKSLPQAPLSHTSNHFPPALYSLEEFESLQATYRSSVSRTLGGNHWV